MAVKQLKLILDGNIHGENYTREFKLEVIVTMVITCIIHTMMAMNHCTLLSVPMLTIFLNFIFLNKWKHLIFHIKRFLQSEDTI